MKISVTGSINFSSNTTPGLGAGNKISISAPSAPFVPPFTPDLGFTTLSGPVSCGSMGLAGNLGSYLFLPPHVGMDFGTGSFTIEWWQKQTDSNPFPRVFSRGNYPSQTMGVSIEGGTFYFWFPGATAFGNIASTKGSWEHIAIVRKNGFLKIFHNGAQLGPTVSNTADYSDGVNNFVLGNEATPNSGAAFGGQITNFHVMKGAAKYFSPFTPDTSSPIPLTNRTTLLLSAVSAQDIADDYSDNMGGGAGYNLSWSSDNPFS